MVSMSLMIDGFDQREFMMQGVLDVCALARQFQVLWLEFVCCVC